MSYRVGIVAAPASPEVIGRLAEAGAGARRGRRTRRALARYRSAPL